MRSGEQHGRNREIIRDIERQKWAEDSVLPKAYCSPKLATRVISTLRKPCQTLQTSCVAVAPCSVYEQLLLVKSDRWLSTDPEVRKSK